jgi:hypothetical protein
LESAFVVRSPDTSRARALMGGWGCVMSLTVGR